MKSLSDYLYAGPVITLENGREISLKRLDQYLTYAHVLEGIAYGPDYDGTVRLHYEWAAQRYPNRKIIVLAPRLRPLAIAEDKLEKLKTWWMRAEDINAKVRSGIEIPHEEWRHSVYPEPVSIGSVCCRAIFESTPIAPRTAMLSELFVIWFQDGFAMPIDSYVIEQIKTIYWENVAEDTDL